MNERLKHRSKDQNREQTAFQLNSRQSRNFLSGRLVSLIRANDQNNEFSAQELIQIESLIRDECQTNPWLLNVCKAITDESVFVSKEELEMFEKCKTEGQEVAVTQSKVGEMEKEVNFLKERLNILRFIFNDLTKKLNEIQKNESNIEMNEKESHSSDFWLQMRIKLKESLEIISRDLTTDFNVEEPKDIVDYITTHFNDKIGEIVGHKNPNDWLNQLFDELSLTEENKKQVLDNFNQRFCLKLNEIHKNVSNLLKECLRIKDFYEVNVRQEMSWRTDLKALINRLHAFNDSTIIELNSLKSETNELKTKKCLIEEYSQFLQKFQKQEFDELEALMKALIQRIQTLSDKTTNANNSTKIN